jgi:hypothetical protein
MIEIEIPYAVFSAISTRGQKWLFLARTPEGLKSWSNLRIRGGNFQLFRLAQTVTLGPAQGLPAGSALITFA